MVVTAKDVKALRDATGAGMMDAKRALVATDGDAEAAKQILREKGLAKAAGRGDRENEEGVVALAVGDGVAAIARVRTETDFSAKSEAITALAAQLAETALVKGADAIDDFGSSLDELKLTLKENLDFGRVERVEAGGGNTLDTYLHMQDGRGVNAVIVEGNGVPAANLHQVALHIAFARPTYLSTDQVPNDQVEKERESLLDITKAEGKPEPAWGKIVDGRLRGWFAERVLLEQGLNGEKTAVKDTLGGGSIVRFVQVTNGA